MTHQAGLKMIRISIRYSVLAFSMATAIMLGTGHARAEDVAADQQRLFDRMMQEPTNHDLTFEFARVATAHGDYEAAIGALERLLFYQPRLARVKYELGALYFRLRSFEMARRYFHEALESPNLDAITRSRIEAYLPDAEKQLQQSRFSGFAQTGIRTQSNASFAPIGDTIRLASPTGIGSQDLSLLAGARRSSDVNWFGLVGLSHDYDFDNQRGDSFETRFTGYATHQFRLDDLDVGLVNVSLGPRLALWPEVFPNVTFKPYFVAGNAWVSGSSYVSSIGGGASLSIPVTTRITVEPDLQWTRADFNTGNLAAVSTFGSGNWLTGSVATSVKIDDQLQLTARTAYRRGDAALTWQAFDQWSGEAALTFSFAPPLEAITRNWSISPFIRVVNTRFDAANPAIDPLVRRADLEWITGAVLDMPINASFGISTTVQFDHTTSTLPNYQFDNLSFLIGPTARF